VCGAASPNSSGPPHPSQTEEYYANNVRLALDQAVTLNPDSYSDEDVFQVEKTAVWESTWVCVGTTTEYAKNTSGSAQVRYEAKQTQKVHQWILDIFSSFLSMAWGVY
jgi:hypothetical protein